MLDLKIKQLSSEVKTEEQAKNILSSQVEIFEKIDGTKLTLYRNLEPYNPTDYTKNWIISYKSNIIYKEEFDGFEIYNNEQETQIENEIEEKSIGTSQYYIVHKYLEEVIHPRAKKLSCNFELFIEFVQRKPTLTRDYTNYHDLFLIGVSKNNLKVFIDHGKYYSTGDIITNPSQVKLIAEDLHIKTPPLIYSGFLVNCYIKIRSRQTHETYLQKLQDISNLLLQRWSSLGGTMEGVVIRSKDSIYKITQPDQYNKKLRQEKKNRYKASTENQEK
jgi:hypothetical protein